MEYPILIYDNMCVSCTNLAKIVNGFLSGKITMVGHYTKQGKDLKNTIFPEGYGGTEMSWFVTDKKAFGGRLVLGQLAKYTFSKKSGTYPVNVFDLDGCTTDCSVQEGGIFRSSSILVNSKIIEYSKTEFR